MSMLLLALVSVFHEIPEPLDDRSLTVYVVDKISRNLRKVSVNGMPSKTAIANTLPRTAKTPYRIVWNCHFAKSGAIFGCNVERSFPINIDLSNFKERIVYGLKLGNPRQALLDTYNDTAVVEAYIDDQTRKLDRNCPVAWCPP